MQRRDVAANRVQALDHDQAVVGLAWRGLPWTSVRQVVVEHADNLLREGRLVVVPRDAASVTDHLDGLGRLHLRWNELWYGAALSVPLGMTTLTDSRDLGGDLDRLADGRTDVVHLRGRQLAQLEDMTAEEPAEERAGERPTAELSAEEPAEQPTELSAEEPAETLADPDPDPAPRSRWLRCAR